MGNHHQDMLNEAELIFEGRLQRNYVESPNTERTILFDIGIKICQPLTDCMGSKTCKARSSIAISQTASTAYLEPNMYPEKLEYDVRVAFPNLVYVNDRESIIFKNQYHPAIA